MMETHASTDQASAAGDSPSAPAATIHQPAPTGDAAAADHTGAGKIGPDSSAEAIVTWSLDHFAGKNLVMTSSFGMEGCVLIDMYARHGVPLTVIYLDTMFFFPETYALRDRLRARYPHLDFVNRGTRMSPDEQAATYGDELWKRDPDQCCKIRKVDPMVTALAGVDVWATALRRSQSITRANLKVVDWDWQYQLIKLAPLAAWERSDVWAYIQKNNVPYNELHEKGYPTVGCTHCTTPVEGVQIGEYSRSGRWQEFEKTECGLHGDGI
jgi:phosphoadenosine phosphosulfate reductase